jgi:translation initiation factor 5B
MIRQPIVTIMGHVDHGKTSILDAIRGSGVAAKEAGGITQAIGASIIPIDTIHAICGDLLKATGLVLSIPGILFIDTPGHAAFVNLRKRGGNLADIAIVVVDITEGLKPQTIESLQVLKSYKTPFIIAANKLDKIGGWNEPKGHLMPLLQKQTPEVQRRIDTKMYELVGQIYEQGFECERFDRIQDYSKQIGIVPVCALTRVGIPELIMTLAGLTQKFLQKNLETSVKSPAIGTIMEVKDQKGLGKIMDVIIYDGQINAGDTLVVGGLDGPVVTKAKGLFQPAPLQEMREKKSKFKSIKQAIAATGIRILATNLDNVVAGMPAMVATPDTLKKIKASIKSQVEEVLVHTDDKGLIIKADSLGSLEALSHLLKEEGIPIKKASIGEISKKDISDAEALFEHDPLDGCILGFNIEHPIIPTNQIKVMTQPVIYKLIDDFKEWKEARLKEMQSAQLDTLTKPCKIQLLKGYVFRQSNPAICGVEVLAGILYSNTSLMNKDGKTITMVKGIQHDQDNVKKAETGKQVAASMPGVTVGRQINEGDILYSAIGEREFITYKAHKDLLDKVQKEILKEIAIIMRKDNPMWGV